MITITKDFHTHSKYSKFFHGKSTIREVVASAAAKGLKTIALTDHAPDHLFGVWPFLLKKRKREIEKLRKEFPSIEILCGLETNLVSNKGAIDVTKKQRADLDFCVLGFHRTAGMFCHPFFAIKMLFGKNKIERNTNAYLNAIENNKIDVVAHLKQYINVDCGKIAAAAAKKGTFIEINNRHLCFNKDDVKAMLATDCKFVVDSDAHRARDVGKFDNAIAFIEKYNIPIERIVNAKRD